VLLVEVLATSRQCAGEKIEGGTSHPRAADGSFTNRDAL
jgi:hypothetical protein